MKSEIRPAKIPLPGGDREFLRSRCKPHQPATPALPGQPAGRPGEEPEPGRAEAGGRGRRKSTFGVKSHFSRKSDFWAPKPEKSKEVIFGRKSYIFAPGDRKKHQESIAYRHIREPGREK